MSEYKAGTTVKKAGTGAVQFGISFVIGKLIINAILNKFGVELEQVTVELFAGAVGSFIHGTISALINFWKMWIGPIVKAWLIRTKENALKKISKGE